MKKAKAIVINPIVFLYSGIFLMAVCLTWALKAQIKLPQPPKTYSVSLTPEQWDNVLGGLESIKNAVKVSSMSAIQSTFISDSLITVYQKEFIRQINKQIEAERQKPEVKKDTTKPKKN